MSEKKLNGRDVVVMCLVISAIAGVSLIPSFITILKPLSWLSGWLGGIAAIGIGKALRDRWES
jgi:hypothetical protein